MGPAPSSATRTATPILVTLQKLQHVFVTNDNSRGAAAGSSATEHAIRHFPNGDLFLGRLMCSADFVLKCLDLVLLDLHFTTFLLPSPSPLQRGCRVWHAGLRPPHLHP